MNKIQEWVEGKFLSHVAASAGVAVATYAIQHGILPADSKDPLAHYIEGAVIAGGSLAIHWWNNRKALAKPPPGYVLAESPKVASEQNK